MSPLQKTGLYAAGTAAGTFATFTLLNWQEDEPVTASDITASLAAGVAVAVFRTIPSDLQLYSKLGFALGFNLVGSITRDWDLSIKTQLRYYLIAGLIGGGIVTTASVAWRFTLFCVKAAPPVFR